MNPFEVYVKYCALKRYFSDWKYDYVRYGGKVRARYESFEKRRDRMWFEKLERHRDPIGVLVFNLAENPNAWIKDIATNPGEMIYCKHRGVIESMTRTMKSELSQLNDDFGSNFSCESGMPPLLKKQLGGKISMETSSLLIEMAGAKEYLKNNFHDVLFDDLVIRTCRLSTFISYDREKARKLVVEHFEKKVGENA